MTIKLVPQLKEGSKNKRAFYAYFDNFDLRGADNHSLVVADTYMRSGHRFPWVEQFNYDGSSEDPYGRLIYLIEYRNRGKGFFSGFYEDIVGPRGSDCTAMELRRDFFALSKTYLMERLQSPPEVPYLPDLIEGSDIFRIPILADWVGPKLLGMVKIRELESWLAIKEHAPQILRTTLNKEFRKQIAKVCSLSNEQKEEMYRSHRNHGKSFLNHKKIKNFNQMIDFLTAGCL